MGYGAAWRRAVPLDALTSTEAAAICRLRSSETLRRAALAGKLRSYRTPGGHRRFRHADVLAYARSIGVPV